MSNVSTIVEAIQAEAFSSEEIDELAKAIYDHWANNEQDPEEEFSRCGGLGEEGEDAEPDDESDDIEG